jgi:hypothetical protein
MSVIIRDNVVRRGERGKQRLSLFVSVKRLAGEGRGWQKAGPDARAPGVTVKGLCDMSHYD